MKLSSRELRESIRRLLREAVCKVCRDDNPYAEPNQPDGSFVCATCRARNRIWGGKTGEKKEAPAESPAITVVRKVAKQLFQQFKSDPALQGFDLVGKNSSDSSTIKIDAYPPGVWNDVKQNIDAWFADSLSGTGRLYAQWLPTYDGQRLRVEARAIDESDWEEHEYVMVTIVALE